MSQMVDNAPTPEISTEPKITVRLFEDGDQEFVMKAELFNAIDQDQYEEVEEEFVATISWKEALQMYGNRIEKIEFVRTLILRTENKAVPIRRPFQDDFGILAVDAFFEMMNSFIIAAKIFQKKAEWEEFEELFELLEDIFKSEEKNLYFLKISSIEMVTSSFMADKSKKSKNVRPVKKDGFTVENLKNELAHLNLTKTFPEIQNYVDVVYSEVDKRKKEEVLRTCDLLDAVEHCQLICILNRLPNLQKFVHNQKGCRRVYGYICSLCASEFPVDSESPTLHNDANNESEVQKMSEVDASKSLDSEKSENCPDCELLKSSNAQLKSKYLRQEEKCKKTQKHLEEQISKLQQELKEEKKKTLEIQNQKKSDEEILEKNRIIEELKKSEIRMKAENEVNQRMIQQLMDKLASSGVSNASGFRRTSEVSTTSSKIQKCEICWNETNDRETVRCQKCRRPFHQKCASQWLEKYMNCPSCEEEFLELTISSLL